MDGRSGADVVVRVVREDCGRKGLRFVIQVDHGDRCATVRTIDEVDTPSAERLARACAIRVARSLHCRIAAA